MWIFLLNLLRATVDQTDLVFKVDDYMRAQVLDATS